MNRFLLAASVVAAVVAITTAHANCTYPGTGSGQYQLLVANTQSVRTIRRDVLEAYGLKKVPGQADARNLLVEIVNDKRARALFFPARLPKKILLFARAIALPEQESLVKIPNYLCLQGTSQDAWHVIKIEANRALRQAAVAAQESRRQILAILDSGSSLPQQPPIDRRWRDPQQPDRPTYGMNYFDSNQQSDLSDRDRFGNAHGTGVTGVIFGDGPPPLKPLAPDARYITLPIGHGSCWYADSVAKSIGYAAQNGASVANLSWELGRSDEIETSMREAKETLFVVAVMNANDVEWNASYPTWYELPNMITVTDSDACDSPTNQRSRRIDIAAPGKDILTVWPTGDLRKGFGGSSAAAPLVSATALLLKSLAPQWTPAQIKRYIVDSAEHPPEWEGHGYGRLNAGRATAAPIAIDWPGEGTYVNAGESRFVVKWHGIFSTQECAFLDAEISLDGGIYTPLLPLQCESPATCVRTAANNAAFAIDPQTRSNRARVKLRCNGTDLAAESDPFQLKPRAGTFLSPLVR